MNIEGHLTHFKDHKATLTDLGEVKILDWKNPNSNHYQIRYIFDENYYRLFISGDLGELVAWNPTNMTFDNFEKYYCNNSSYFIEKIQCMERKMYWYREEQARKELEERLEDSYFDEYIAEVVEDCMEYFSDEYGFDYYGIFDMLNNTDLSDIDLDYWEWITDCGKEISAYIYLYLAGFKLAMEDLRSMS